MQSHDCKDELRQAGSKATPGRLALLGVLEAANKPLTVNELEKSLRRLNLVTLYRALESLVQAGLVRRGVHGRVAHFEYAGKPHHHHMVCADCGFNKVCNSC